MTKRNRWKIGTLLPLLCLALAIIGQAQTVSTLVTFHGKDGALPVVSLIQGPNGNLYGETELGGLLSHCGGVGCGVVFQLAPTGKMNTLAFCPVLNSGGICSDGDLPDAALLLSSDGSLYGTTTVGGSYDSGTVFKITSQGVLTTLYNFGVPNSNDGSFPVGALVQATDGNFYGATAEGSTYGVGTIFKMSPSGGLATLHSFDSTEGASPSGLVEASNGKFFGTTNGGGPNNSGTVFEITSSGTLTTLYNFCSQAGCADGAVPFAQLVQATDGNFYGTTGFGGNPSCQSGCGTVFKITPSGVLTTIHAFCSQPNCADGAEPVAGLIQGTDGKLYGTAALGGAGGVGTIFSVTTDGAFTTLYTFCPSGNDCADGREPQGSLLQDTSGRFYGSTGEGGNVSCHAPYGCGTLFSLDMSLGPFVSFVRAAGKVGQTGGILGQGFTGTTSVVLNGTPANFTVVSDTFIRATVPQGATTGFVAVTTPSGVLTSNVPFHVLP